MDDDQVGYWLVVGSIVFTLFVVARPIYAIYLEEGAKFFFVALFFPFIVCYRFIKIAREVRREWVEEIIERHKNARKIDANS